MAITKLEVREQLAPKMSGVKKNGVYKIIDK